MVQLKVNSALCKYDIVKQCLADAKLKDTEGDDWNLIWIDTATSFERVLFLKPHQMINHFPGMIEICRKDFLARNVARAQKLLPSHYTFFPRTWILPQDLQAFSAHIKSHRKTTYISKPDNSCQGLGIFLFQTLQEYINHTTTYKTRFQDAHTRNDCVIQEYKDEPLLLDGFKFDLRIYVLVKSIDPLVVYIYEEGLVRLATIPYTAPTPHNMSSLTMHLTNYAITKTSDAFITDDTGSSGSKRSLTSFWKSLLDRSIDIAKLRQEIHAVIVKTVLLIQPDIKRVMSTHENPLKLDSKCFEVLGFDVMIDKGLRPIVLEVNHSPSFACESALDLRIKTALISDTLTLLSDDFSKLSSTHRHATLRLENLYTKIYPSEDKMQQGVYDACLMTIQDNSGSQSTKAESERRKWIKEKLESVEKSREEVRVWKEKHSEKTRLLASNHELRPVERVKIEKRVERQSLTKVVLKLSVTDLCFGL